MGRLTVNRGVSMLALALATAVCAAATASSTHSSTTVSGLNGFAGPVTSGPRAIDRDLERSTPGALQRVACPTGSAFSCWIAAH